MRWGLLLLAVATACDDNFAGPCGNGALDPFEECDDGNIEPGDLCSANCTREPSCGDRVIDSPRENCDDGNTVPGDNCDETCRTETVCGDLDIEPGEMCEDGNADPGDGCSETCTIEYKVHSIVRWSFVTAADLVERGCPDGFDSIEITTQTLRSDDTLVHAPVVERVSCADGKRERPWYIGRYRVSVHLTDATGVSTYAPPHVAIMDLHLAPRDVAARFIVDGGVARAAWRLVDAAGDPRTCAQLGILSIGVLATSPAFSTSRYVLCSGGVAETAPLPAGDYTLHLTAFDNLGNELGFASRPLTVGAPSGVADVGTVEIAVSPASY
jgi:cysteine-rich repeat protein